MPVRNNFQHSEYIRSNPAERVRLLQFEAGAPPDSPAWQDAIARLGGQLAEAGVRVLIFLHGSLLNSDPFGVQRLDEAGGLKRGYSRGIPGVDALLALMRDGSNGFPTLPGGLKPPFRDDEQVKRLLDTHSRDAGNYTATAVEAFRKALNRDLPRAITCIRYVWASEHHHLGRALAAVQLLHRIRTVCQESQLGTGDRILVLAHGQAGLVLALVSNLLAPGPSSGRRHFLDALQSYATVTGAADLLALIQQLEAQLAEGQALNGTTLDVVTFGTPVRYGWDPSGLGKLLHFVNHRPMRLDGKTWLAKMELPQITMEMPIAWGGDYLQQLAVAGSDAVPTSPEAQTANKALWELLEPYDGFERWLECARKAVRCQNDGICLLVDYKDSGSATPRDHYYGHAAYTRANALLFNTTQIVQTLYA